MDWRIRDYVKAGVGLAIGGILGSAMLGAAAETLQKAMKKDEPNKDPKETTEETE